MKKTIFKQCSHTYNKDELIGDISESLNDSFGPTWRLLQTPIVLDNDLIDMLLVNDDGGLCIVSVLEPDDDATCLGRIIAEYDALNSKRKKLHHAYPHENIDVRKPIALKLLTRGLDEACMRALRMVMMPVQVYQCMYVASHDSKGLVVEERSWEKRKEKKEDAYASMLRVMGENARSRESQVKEEDVDFVPVHKEITKAIENDADIKTDVTLSDEIREDEEQNEFGDVHTSTFHQRAQLTEEELIAFYDLEKKIDSYCNIVNDNE